MLGTFIQQTVNALTIGSIYALIALGYTMVYGVLRMINFAHGEMFMLGAYAAFLVLAVLVGDIGTAGALAFTLTFFIAVIAAGFVGVGIERLAYKPLRSSTRLAPMLSSLGVSLSLVTGVQILAGPQPVAFPNFFPATRYNVFGGTVTSVQIGIRTHNDDFLGVNVIDAREVHETGPAAVARPWTRAITGCGSVRIASIKALQLSISCCVNACPWSGSARCVVISLRSCPAQKAAPFAARMTARTERSPPSAASAARSAVSTAADRVLRC